MRLSPDHPPADGAAGFVILVHDPHSDVAGRYSLLRGLQEMLAANPNTRVCFLVEGAFHQVPGQTYDTLLERKINDNGIHKGLGGLNREAQSAAIFHLAGRYLIDVPRAYQELHPTSAIASYKIDDNRYLLEPKITRVSEADLDKALNSLGAVIQKELAVEHAKSAAALNAHLNPLLENFFMIRAMMGADVFDMNDEDAVGYEFTLAFRLASLADIASKRYPGSPQVARVVGRLIHENASLRQDLSLRHLHHAGGDLEASIRTRFGTFLRGQELARFFGRQLLKPDGLKQNSEPFFMYGLVDRVVRPKFKGSELKCSPLLRAS